MIRVLALWQAAFAVLISWALYIDITQDKNQWWGTLLLMAAWLMLTFSAIALWRKDVGK